MGEPELERMDSLRPHVPTLETVSEAEEQEAVILEYLAREGFAYRQDIARILRIEVSQCRGVLQRMVAAGQIEQDLQRYILKDNSLVEV